MQIKYIKKRSGRIRTIYAVSAEERRMYRDLLSQISLPESLLKHAHGFMPKKSIVTNALQHVKKKMTINMDLSDFFDSVTPLQTRRILPTSCYDHCFLDKDGYPDYTNGAPRQGLPTSPAIANIAAIPMDKAIMKKLIKLQIPGAVYTRYADDLSISCDTDSQEIAETIIKSVKEIVKRCGFKVNPQKTHVLRDKSRREVCGIMVDDTIHISRRQRRKLRAAKHNYAMALKNSADEKTISKLAFKVKGLTEFAKLKVPNKKKVIIFSEKERFADARVIARNHRIQLPVKVNKIIQERELEANVKITNDPSMFYGMSSFTDGWISCMKLQSGHGYHRGTAFWQRHPGVSIAYIDSGETMSICGVRRPKMKARCLIYALEDGRFAYDHIYDNTGHRHYLPKEHPLAKELYRVGFNSVLILQDRTMDKGGWKRGRRLKILGEVNKSCKMPFFDSVWCIDEVKDGKVVRTISL